jgi:hypothetical protein
VSAPDEAEPDPLREWLGDVLGERHGCRADARMALSRPPCPHCAGVAEYVASAWRERPPATTN